MKTKAAAYIIGALSPAIFFIGVSFASVLPGENPKAFRAAFHRVFLPQEHLSPISLPEVLPEAPRVVYKSAGPFSDLLVSDSIVPANFIQQNPDIVTLTNGRVAAVWEDDRQGPIGIYLQLLDNAGNPLGGNTALISASDYDLRNPSIGVGPNGDFCVVWREDIGGFLQAVFFDSLADQKSSIFFVSDTLVGGYAGEFDAGCLPDGRLIVAWENYTSENLLTFRMFSTAGIPLISETAVNSDTLSALRWSPDIAVAPNGDFGIVWEDYRDGFADVYFRRYSSLGLDYGKETTLADAGAPDSDRYMPSTAYSSADGYLVGWVDLRDGQNIYLQRLNSAGVRQGSNVLMTTETSGYANWEIDLGVNSSNNLLAVWTVYGAQNTVFLQKFLAGAQIDGSPLGVSDVGAAQRPGPAVTGNKGGNAAIVWTEHKPGAYDIFGSVVSNDGLPVRLAYLVNDDIFGSHAVDPDVVPFDPFEWTVVFTDNRRDAGDIMLQRVYVEGELIGANRRINADSPGGNQSEPAVSAGAGRICVSWTDTRLAGIGGLNIFCRFSTPSYELTPEIVVNNDSLGSAAHYDSDCAINTDSVALIVWTDTRTGVPRIVGQLFDANNIKSGVNFQIGPAGSGVSGENPRVSIDGNGAFVVTYLNRIRAGGPAIEAKRVTVTGQVSNVFVFASDKAGYQIDGFDAGVGSDNITMVWHGLAADKTELFLAVFDYAGNIVSASMAVTDNPAAMPDMPDIYVDNIDHIVITWIDHRAVPSRPFRQIFDAFMAPMGSNAPVTSDLARFSQQPATAGYRGKGVYVWPDARQDGLRIYATQEIYEPTDVDNPQNLIPARFSLEQNFPNPFNPSTRIRFTLNSPGYTRLDVFNLLGQRIRTVVDRVYPAGSHEVTWDGTTDDGRPAASGVYFYRLQKGPDRLTRKMTLIK